MRTDKYKEIMNCLNDLKAEFQIESLPNKEDEKKPEETNNPVDIITVTAKSINDGKTNVYRDEEVNWEEVTMFDMTNIRRLLSLVETKYLDSTADAIIMSITSIYDPDYLYYKPTVVSKYYSPSSRMLPEIGDWNYDQTILYQVKTIKEKRNKADQFYCCGKTQSQEQIDIERAELFKLREEVKEVERLKLRVKELESQLADPTEGPICDIVSDNKIGFKIDGAIKELKPSQKVKCYLLRLLAEKSLPQITSEENRILAFIIGTTHKTFETTVNKILKPKQEGYGQLSLDEKAIFRHLCDKYKLGGKGQEPIEEPKN